MQRHAAACSGVNTRQWRRRRRRQTFTLQRTAGCLVGAGAVATSVPGHCVCLLLPGLSGCRGVCRQSVPCVLWIRVYVCPCVWRHVCVCIRVRVYVCSCRMQNNHVAGTPPAIHCCPVTFLFTLSSLYAGALAQPPVIQARAFYNGSAFQVRRVSPSPSPHLHTSIRLLPSRSPSVRSSSCSHKTSP